MIKCNGKINLLQLLYVHIYGIKAELCKKGASWKKVSTQVCVGKKLICRSEKNDDQNACLMQTEPDLHWHLKRHKLR